MNGSASPAVRRRSTHVFRKAGPGHRLRLAPPAARAPLWRGDAVLPSSRVFSPLRKPGFASLLVPADLMRRMVRKVAPAM